MQKKTKILGKAFNQDPDFFAFTEQCKHIVRHLQKVILPWFYHQKVIFLSFLVMLKVNSSVLGND